MPRPAAFLFVAFQVHLLYLDDSGSTKNAADHYVVLAGVSAFERRPYYISRELDRIAARVWPESPDTIEFKGVDMMSGRKHWRGLEKPVREQALKEALMFIANQSAEVRLGLPRSIKLWSLRKIPWNMRSNSYAIASIDSYSVVIAEEILSGD